MMAHSVPKQDCTHNAWKLPSDAEMLNVLAKWMPATVLIGQPFLCYQE
jgi:hypothetical protein